MKIFGICGSLRKNSSNAQLLKAAQIFLNKHRWSSLYLDELPYFDPDQQFSEKTPELVKEMRKLASGSDLILISTPEYAHGVPGLLKNALEWLFCEGTQRKPAAVIIGSAQGEYVRDQLSEILKTMDFVVDAKSFLIVQGARTKINQEAAFTDLKAQFEFESFLSKQVDRRQS